MAALFITVNMLIAIAALTVGLAVLGSLRRRARRRGKRIPAMILLLGTIGLLLIEAGIAQALLDYAPFDPHATALNMRCTRRSESGTRFPEHIHFEYRPMTQCVKHTYYQVHPFNLDHILIENGGMQIATLSYQPDFADPRRKGVFTRVETDIDSREYRRLKALASRHADGLCPLVSDEAAHRRRDQEADALRIAAEGLHGAEEVFRWDCSG